MAYYQSCPECGANLDPGEVCDCKKKAAEDATPDGKDMQNTYFLYSFDYSIKARICQ